MAEKMLEIKTNRGKAIVIPIRNISYVEEGEGGVNYIYLKDNSQPIETTRYIGAIKAAIEEYEYTRN